jgi:hypothetical protein
MRFKEEFLKELLRRLKENIDIIESAFYIANMKLEKNDLYNVEPIDYHLTLLVDNNPYEFLRKLNYCIVNKQEVKVSTKNIACEILFDIVNLILDEFSVERIGKIGD